MSNLKKSLDCPGTYGIQTSLTSADSNPGDLEARRESGTIPGHRQGNQGPLFRSYYSQTQECWGVCSSWQPPRWRSRSWGKQERQRAHLGPHDSTLAYSGISHRNVWGCSESKSLRGLTVFKDKVLWTQEWSFWILREGRGREKNIGYKENDLVKWGTHAWEPMKKGHKRELEPKTHLKGRILKKYPGMQGCWQGKCSEGCNLQKAAKASTATLAIKQ